MNQFLRNKKQEEAKKKKEWDLKVEAFLADFRVLENKHGIMFRPIITADGPRIIPQELPEDPPPIPGPNKVSEKSYVKTTEPSSPSEANELPKE